MLFLLLGIMIGTLLGAVITGFIAGAKMSREDTERTLGNQVVR